VAITHGVAEQEARLEKRLAEFQAAERRRLVKQGIALWNHLEAAHMAASQTAPPTTKID
jgi:hypothetical protein